MKTSLTTIVLDAIEFELDDSEYCTDLTTQGGTTGMTKRNSNGAITYGSQGLDLTQHQCELL